MTDVFKHAKRLPDNLSHSDAFDSLFSQLSSEEREDEGYIHDVAVALAERAERSAKQLIIGD